MSEKARVREFRRAHRNSQMVRVLRVVYPICAVGLLGAYVLAMRQSYSVPSDGEKPDGKLTFRPGGINPSNFTMSDPTYEGFTDDGSRFVVKAKTAVTPTERHRPIKLKTITGTITQSDNTVTKLTADHGAFHQASSKLNLQGGIKIVSSNGMKANLISALVRPKVGLIESGEPVTVWMPSGRIDSNGLQIRQKQRVVIFRKGVTANLKPSRGKPAPSMRAQTSRKKTDANGLPVLGASQEPVVVTAQRLHVNDLKSEARFEENVVARQGDADLKAKTLTVFYKRSAESKAPGQDGKPAQNPKPAGALSAQSGQLERIVARGNVVVTRANDTITAAEAVFNTQAQSGEFLGGVRIVSEPNRTVVAKVLTFNQKRQSALLVGNVVVTQGDNRLQGQRLSIDQGAGLMVLTHPPAKPGRGAGRISARFVRPANEGSAKAQPKLSENDGRGTALTTGWSFRSDSNAPIDITARRLRVNDKAKTALFDGGVEAVQGDFKLTGAQLTAKYAGSAQVMPSADQTQKGAPAQGAQIKQIIADGGVVITSMDQTARGERAVFDVAANTVTLIGKVQLRRGRQIVHGDRVVIDVASGKTRIFMDAAPPAIVGRTGKDGRKRMRATFYPSDLKRMQEEMRAQRKGGKAKAPAGSAWSPVHPNGN